MSYDDHMTDQFKDSCITYEKGKVVSQKESKAINENNIS